MDQKEKIREIINDTRVGMFVTQEDGQLFSRPIALSQIDEDFNLWFFTDLTSDKVDEIANNKNVNFSFSDPDANSYVSVSGKAELVKDQEKIDELWNVFVEAWYPKEGKESEKLTLVKVKPTTARYWNGSSSKIMQLYNVAKAVITNTRQDKVSNSKSDIVEFV